MKEKEGLVDCPEQQMILFVEKENGEYGPVQTGSYITRYYIDDFFAKRHNLIQALREQVAQGEISPVSMFMTLEDLTLKELASRVGFPSRKVKKHLKPNHFQLLTQDQLERYATVFHITPEQLLSADASILDTPQTEESPA